MIKESRLKPGQYDYLFNDFLGRITNFSFSLYIRSNPRLSSNASNLLVQSVAMPLEYEKPIFIADAIKFDSKPPAYSYVGRPEEFLGEALINIA